MMAINLNIMPIFIIIFSIVRIQLRPYWKHPRTLLLNTQQHLPSIIAVNIDKNETSW
jgi:hypothetical protein